MKDLLRGCLVMGVLAYFIYVDHSLHAYWFFVLFAGAVLLPEILFMRQKKKRKITKKTNVQKKNPSNTSNESINSDVRPNKKKKKTDQEIIQTPLEQLDGYEFERLVALYFADKGYQPKIVGGAGDHEVDIILTDPKENYKIAVQCKHWKSRKVGNDTIIRLAYGKRVHKCLQGWCITTNYYTKAALEVADAYNIKLWNSLNVHTTIEKWQQEKAQQLQFHT